MSDKSRPVPAQVNTWHPVTALDADVYVFSGPLHQAMPPHGPDDRVIKLAARPRLEHAYLFISTFGGHALPAYRMMRCLRHCYSRVTVVVAGPCKSAGTLVVVGADELVMTGAGELGPLDVQLPKDNEIFEVRSGLTTGMAFDSLKSEAIKAFKDAFLEMKLGGKMTTSTAASTAAALTEGLFAPIYAQVDPLRVGETMMANMVAYEYAHRLQMHEGKVRSNISPEGLANLVFSYPSHDFAIDRTEANEMFERVRSPSSDEHRVIDSYESILVAPTEKARILRISLPSQEVVTDGSTHGGEPVGGDREPAEGGEDGDPVEGVEPGTPQRSDGKGQVGPTAAIPPKATGRKRQSEQANGAAAS